MALEIDGKIIYFPKDLNQILADWIDEVEFEGDMFVDEEEGIFAMTDTSFQLNGTGFEVRVECNEPSAIIAISIIPKLEIPELLHGQLLELINDGNLSMYCGHLEKYGNYIRFRHSIDVENALPTPSLITNSLSAGLATFTEDFINKICSLTE